jgi:Zn-dependent peptidase ImmA (M78 family)
MVERGFKAWAEREAAVIRGRLGLNPGGRLAARVLLKHLGATVIRPDQVPGMTAADILQLTKVDATGWSALTLTYEDQHIVILNDAHDVPRQESDLYHEASHLMRGHKPCQLVSVGGMTFREYDYEAEQEAAWLAGCLHLPRPALLSALGRGDSEAVIGTQYAASPEMVRYRRSVTGVDRQLQSRASR